MQKVWMLLLTLMAANFGIAEAPLLKEEIRVDTMLRWLVQFDQLPYLRAWECFQFSSYDRTGGNADAGNFLRREDNVAVLAEMEGAGAIVRIWSANPSGRMRIYLDDMEKPVIDCPMRDFFEGRFPPIRPPLAMPSSGGVVSYFPIPFAQKMRVTVQDPGTMYYHVTVIQFPKGVVKVRTLKLPLSDIEQATLEEVFRVWTSPIALPFGLGFETHTVSGKTTKTIAHLRGPAIITGMFVTLRTKDFLAWRRAILRIFWDGEKTPSVEAPLCDFFGSGFGPTYVRSLLIGFTDEGIGYCRFPMPFAKSAHITIENGMAFPIEVGLGLQMRRVDAKALEEKGYFHARWFWWFTRKGIHHQFAKAQNVRGHFVGAVMSIQSAGGLGFLEGDELFYCDGKKVFNGTGTENYYNSGWYFATGNVIAPLHGCVRKTEDSINAYRFHINDAVVWQKEANLQIEHGGVSDTEGVEYSSVAYWYQGEPHTDFFRLPSASTLNFPRLPIILPPTAIIASELIQPQKGIDVLPLFKFTNAAGMEAVVVRPPQKTLILPLKEVGLDRASLFGYFVKRKDFGSVRIFIGEKLVGTVNLASDTEDGRVVRLHLGSVRLSPDLKAIRLEGDGKRIFAVLGFEFISQSQSMTKP